MAKEKKEPKKRADKYDAKLKVKGTFEDVIKASFLKPKNKDNKKASE
ncbi:hypothetical protein [Cytophaga aurantiaca]|nr:hypothetical protein [Cytophaga aurantiaca]